MKGKGIGMVNGQQQVNIKADDATLRGAYANSMLVSHTREEFVLDFLNVFPPQGTLVNRIITSPGHLKRIIAALSENLVKYERSFGNIEASKEPDRSIGFKSA